MGWSEWKPFGGGNYKPHNLAPYNDRCTIDSGGYYIKDEICYVDLILTMKSNTSNNATITNMPTKKSSSKIEYLSAYDLTSTGGSATFKLNANETPLSSNATSGHLYRIYGAYETTDADT